MLIREHDVGHDGVYIIAEAGSNHAGKLQYAKQCIEVAADCGANAVKFQRFRVALLQDTGQYKPEVLDKLAKLELRDEWLPLLANLAHQRGIDLIITPFDPEGVTILRDYVDCWKIRHTDWDNSDIWSAIGNEPTIASVPADRWDNSLKIDHPNCVLLYCTRLYPTPLTQLHLPDFTELYGAGLSDHTISLMAGALAVARGACVLEKHFALGGKKPPYYRKCVDGQVSLSPDRLLMYIINVRNAEQACTPREFKE